MDFFKSVFSADPEPSDSPRKPHDHEKEEEEEEEEEKEEGNPPNPNPNPNPSGASGSWSFGGLMKSIATRSESVIQTYRRDLEEFGSGLKKETEAIKEVASRAVRDLPGSLEAGASVAQDSLESVGQALDEFGGTVWKGTADIISQSKGALLSVDSDANSSDPHPAETSKRYSRLEAQVLAIQNDANTYVEAPEDAEEFEKWKLGFRLEQQEEEIEVLLYENGVLEGFFEKFVPDVVDLETFWSRYLYRVYKLQLAEEARAKLVKRVISTEEEEELSWEVDDDDDREESEKKEVQELGANKDVNKNEDENLAVKEIAGTLESAKEKKPTKETTKGESAETLEKPKEDSTKMEIVETSEYREAPKVDNLEEKENAKSNMDNNKPPLAMKTEHTASSKDSDFSVISRQPSMQDDDDLGWDEIEDLGEHDDKKVDGSTRSPRKEDVRKRLIIAEDDEDLSWDIEDDEDLPTKT